MKRFLLLGLMILLGACSGKDVPVETNRPTFPAPIAAPAVADTPPTDIPSPTVWSGSTMNTTVTAADDNNRTPHLYDGLSLLAKKDSAEISDRLYKINARRETVGVAIIIATIPEAYLREDFLTALREYHRIDDKPQVLLVVGQDSESGCYSVVVSCDETLAIANRQEIESVVKSTLTTDPPGSIRAGLDAIEHATTPIPIIDRSF